MSLANARAFAKRLDQFEEVIGLHERRVVCYHDGQPEPLHDVNDLVIMTQALDPDPLDCGATSHPQGDTQTPVNSRRVKYVEPLPAPVELPRDPLQVLAEQAGVVAERDERGHVSIRDDLGTLIWAGPLRYAFAELEGRVLAASKLQPLGDRGL